MSDNILIKEEIFHDNWAENINIESIDVDQFFSIPTAPENRWIKNQIGEINGKKILELGCGAGEASVYFAKQGGKVTATDISEKMLIVAQKLATKNNVSIETKKVSANELPFGDDEFDIVYAANLLHHVDIGHTASEIKRVLKQGGIFCSWDPVAYNPLINIYRKMATEVRTDDEHPLKLKDLKTIKKHFSNVRTKGTWFFTLYIFVKFYLIDRINPNQERYWKKIIYDYSKIEKIYTRLEKIDNFILSIFPFLKYLCWNISIIAKK